MTEHTPRPVERMRSRRAAAIAGGLAAAFLATVAASAGAQSFDQPDRALVSTSGNHSELVTSVPIGTAPGQGTLVMSLPFKGQPLQNGDGLNSSSELQVTTDCTASGDDCVGTPYSYTPQIDTRLILTSNADPTGSGGSGTTATLAQETGRTCTQAQHHCVIVFPFPDSPFQVSSPPPPCTLATGGCRLNVVLSAYNAQAQPTDRLIIGENEPGCCGITAQDKGRVNAVRLRPVVPGPAPSGQVTTYLTSKPLVTSVPVRDTVSEGKTVVLSQPLDNLRKNEQLAVSANQLICGLANDHVDASQPRADARLGQDDRGPDVGGVLDMSAAAQLARPVAEAHDAYDITVFLFEEVHRALRDSFLVCLLTFVKRKRRADLFHHSFVDALQLRFGDCPVQRDVKRRVVGTHPRTFLHHLVAQDLTKRLVEQMSR